jgi:plasmid maintenance system antidote protein VapI
MSEKRVARRPIHPGEFLRDELEEIGISAAELARQIHVPARQRKSNPPL